MQHNKRSPWMWIVGLLAVGFCMFMVFGIAIVFYGAKSAMVLSDADVAILPVKGVITGSGEVSPLLGETGASAETVVKRLERVAKDPNIRAVVLRVNSPGGTVAGSQEIYDAIVRFHRTGKKIVTSMSDLAASGGYYISSATDKIIAERGTLTGSIGVIMQGMDAEGLMKKIGVRANTIKSGSHKDMLSPFRAMTAEEKAMLQHTSDEIHAQFIRDVALGRQKNEAEIRKLADGSILTGERAKKLGLVDQLGGLHDAVREAAKLAGITGEPRVVNLGRTSLFDLFRGGGAESLGNLSGDALTQAVRLVLSRPTLALPTVCLR